MSDLEAPQFALSAYPGACLWVSAFLSLGYFLGDRWEAVERNVHNYLVYLTFAGVMALAGWWIWRRRRGRAR